MRFLCFILFTLSWHSILAMGIEHLNIQILNASAYVCELIDHNNKARFEYASSIIPEFISAHSLTSPMIIGPNAEMTLHYGCEGNGEATFRIKSYLDFYSKHHLSIDTTVINIKATYQTHNFDSTNKHILLRIE